jgi:DNA modification methylase
VCEQLGRSAIGVELLAGRVAIIRGRVSAGTRVIEGDARRLDDYGVGAVDLCMTSPPYMAAAGHPWNPLTAYRTLDADYDRYLAELRDVFAVVARHVRAGGHIAVNVANLRYQDEVTPLAWDLARVLSGLPGLTFCGEIYLDWDEPPHWLQGDYCLVFRNGSGAGD